MKYLFQKYAYYYDILNDDADFKAGSVYPVHSRGPHNVCDDKGYDVAVVRTIGDAIPALAKFYEKHPPRWHPGNPGSYNMSTQFGNLRVERDQNRNWLAYRGKFPMMRGGEPATFRTFRKAQRAAEAHLTDYFPNSEIIDDGLLWVPDPEIDWRKNPRRVATRAKLAA
jgi:hypothetical protein